MVDESRRQRQEVGEFRERLYDRWQLPLERLRMLISISREFGNSVSQDARQSANAVSRSHLIEVLSRSHARACQITDEIVWLLEGGFADGAMARWRTLHELTVVASFIAYHGEALAERYVLHQTVEANRAAKDYQDYCQRLGLEPLQESELASLRSSTDSFVLRFGKEFRENYGWASHHLRIPKPDFRKIELAVGVDYLRPYYRMASHNVHANPKGIFFRLGVSDESHVLLAGPSNAGLADPGQCAALSLGQICGELASLQPSVDHNLILQVIVLLVTEIADLFGQAHTKLEDDERKIRAAAIE
jgi:hypothetical protein